MKLMGSPRPVVCSAVLLAVAAWGCRSRVARRPVDPVAGAAGTKASVDAANEDASGGTTTSTGGGGADSQGGANGSSVSGGTAGSGVDGGSDDVAGSSGQAAGSGTGGVGAAQGEPGGSAGSGGTSTAGTGAAQDEPGGSAGSGGAAGAATGGSSGAPAIGKFVGNITSVGNKIDISSGQLVYSDYWDAITPEHAGTWGAVQPSAGSGFGWSALDAVYDYAEENRIAFIEDSFVWGAQQPSGSITEEDVRNWMQAFCARYPHTKVINVVNEPPPHTRPQYADAIGGGTDSGTWQWITNAFVWARAACPDAILILNDYNVVEYSEDNSHIIDIVKTIMAADAPIDAVGVQAWSAAEQPISSVKELMDNINSETGLPLYITAYRVDDGDDDSQLQKYQEQFPVFWNTEYVHGITIWGWDYDSACCGLESYLVSSGQSRPAMTWLMQQLGRPAP